MPTRTWCPAVIASFLLVGCSVMHPRIEKASNKLDCDGARDCTIAVTVTCSRFYGCDMSVDYDLVLVLGRAKSTDIRWELHSEPGVEFAGNGIVVQSSLFNCRQDEKHKFSCTDLNQGFGLFKYTINVAVKDSTFGPRGVQSLDGWIVNN